jgi:glycerol kinase
MGSDLEPAAVDDAGTVGGLAGTRLTLCRTPRRRYGILVDVGTSTAGRIVRDDATVDHVQHRPFPQPFPGLVEFDAAEMAARVLEVATAALAAGGPVDAVGTLTSASTVVWDRATGEPVAGHRLQDLRTVSTASHWPVRVRVAPNQSVM